MRFIVDECTGPKVAKWLKSIDHDVFSVYEQSRGINDIEILKLAVKEKRILITNDKDFGEMIFREKKAHNGIIFLRLNDERSAMKIKVIENVLMEHPDEIKNNFIVASENNLRVIHL